MGKYFGTDGFRGEANRNLTYEHAIKIGRFLGWYYGKKQGKKAPFIYLAIGVDDNLLESNRTFRDFLKKEKADFFYEEGPGRHTWQFWNEYIDRGLKTVLNR